MGSSASSTVEDGRAMRPLRRDDVEPARGYGGSDARASRASQRRKAMSSAASSSYQMTESELAEDAGCHYGPLLALGSLMGWSARWWPRSALSRCSTPPTRTSSAWGCFIHRSGRPTAKTTKVRRTPSINGGAHRAMEVKKPKCWARSLRPSKDQKDRQDDSTCWTCEVPNFFIWISISSNGTWGVWWLKDVTIVTHLIQRRLARPLLFERGWQAHGHVLWLKESKGRSRHCADLLAFWVSQI